MPKWTSEQLDAIERDGSNIIVSAGAGSGKTAVLSERVIHKLEKGIHVDELLILTFTKAAAEEMKDRIRKKINERDDLKSEADRIDSAYITTFDSYALSIVKKYHYLLNIGKDIDITDESIVNLAKSRILDEVFNSFYESEDALFQEFIKMYSVKTDNSIKENIRGLIDKLDSMLDRNEYLNSLKNDFYKDDNLDRIIDCYRKYVNEKKEYSLKLLNEMNMYFDTTFVLKIEEVALPVINNFDIESGNFITKFRLPNAPRGCEDDAKNKKNELKSSLDELVSLANFGSIEDIKFNILKTKNTTFVIIRIIEEFFKRLDAYKKSMGIYTFQDIALLAISVFENFESARMEVKNSFKEIMIDEYQDTNDVQEVFMSYLENNNVYMVGDIKQSIYRFRGSNPFIFKNKYDEYSRGNGGVKIDLLKNFRSRDEVLDNINHIFALIMDDDLGGANYIVSHAMVYGNHAYDDAKEEVDYNFEVLEYANESDDYSDSEVEIFTIANDIKNKINSSVRVFDKNTSELRGIKYSDFVIILDRSKYFDDFKKIFEYKGIPLDVLHDGELNASIDIEIIKNIIDLILHIENRLFDAKFKFDFLSIGRSFLYEYSDEYLFDIIANNKYSETSLYKDFYEVNINSITSSELLDYILSVTSFTDKLYKVGDYENTNVRLEAINNLSSNLNNLGLTIEEFNDYLGDIISKEYKIKYSEYKEARDAVRILTIHKSKGLEYPVCYFADLSHDFNTQELRDRFIIDKKYGLIAPIEGTENGILKLLYKEDFNRDEIDEKIRLFYVALTRAREKMIMVLPEKELEKYGKSDSGAIELRSRLKIKSLADFIYMIKPYLSDNFKAIDVGKIGLSKGYLYNNSSREFESFSDAEFEVEEILIENDVIDEEHFSKESSDLIDSKTREKMDYGTKVHEVLELIDFKNYDESLIDDEFIRMRISNFINNLKNIESASIYKEYEFYYEEDKKNYHGIIDLMLEYDDHIEIVDYKLKSIQDDKYKEQLNGYKKYISRLSNKPIKTYLYSIIDGEFREI